MVDKEIESLFYSDVASKKSIARSAVSASRTSNAIRKYGLNRNYRIKKDKEENTLSVNMYKYIPWKKFKELPTDLQEEYLQRIVDEYQIWSEGIARLWLGEVSRESVRMLCIKLGVVRSIPIDAKPKQENVIRFLNDYGKSENVLIPNRKKPHKKDIREAKKTNQASTEHETIDSNKIEIVKLETKEPSTTEVKKVTTTNYPVGNYGEIEFELTQEGKLVEIETQIHKFLDLFVSDNKDSIFVRVSVTQHPQTHF